LVRQFFHYVSKRITRLIEHLDNLNSRHKIVDKLIKKNYYARLHTLVVTQSQTQ